MNDHAARTKLRFVDGFEPDHALPDIVRGIGFQHRFAVIQDTFRPDIGEMHFDEALWLRLLGFARGFLSGTTTGILRWKAKTAEEPDAYLAAWRTQPAADRMPESVVVRDERHAPVLVVDVEYWASVGGPWPYSDSYTYSIYSYDDLAARVLAVLRADGGDEKWEFAPRVLPPGEAGLRTGPLAFATSLYRRGKRD